MSAADSENAAMPPGPGRWWIYQKERFPVLQHGLLVLAFSACAVIFSSLLNHTSGKLTGAQFGIAFIVCLLFFLQLRIADEFKDFEEDSRYRPYRAVPRGLVRLRELGWVFAGAALLQLLCTVWLDLRLLWVLVLAWAYLAGMSMEFGCREWLKARPITYLWTHMLIMPMVDFFATACHWMPVSGSPPSGLAWFLAASFANGLVIELGRKLRIPEAEEEGVPTYSKLWGWQRAPLVWLCCVAASLGCGWMSARQISHQSIATIPFVSFFAICGWLAWRFRRHPSAAAAKQFELLAGISTLALYLTLASAIFFRQGTPQ